MTIPPYLGVSWVNNFTEASRPNLGSAPGSVRWNIQPAIQGSPGSRYVVIGWKRITMPNADLSNNVLGIDWVEMRTLTGT